MRFTAAVLPHFATQDIPSHRRFVKVLGLGGKYVLDYGTDAMQPQMGIEEGDFLFFNPESGQPMDRLYVDCPPEGEVNFCPGTRHYYDVRCKEGFTDVAVINPAGAAPDVARRCVVVAPAQRSRPERLAPGDTWFAEAQITAYNDYWPLAPFEKDDPSTVPTPPAAAALPAGRRLARAGDVAYDDEP
jgi:hypothetical protein